MARRRITPKAQARANRIAAALAGLLEDEPPPAEPSDGRGDPYRPIPKAPTAWSRRRKPQCPACDGELELHYSRGVDIHRCGRFMGLCLGPDDLDQMVIPPDDEETVTPAEVDRKMRGVRPPVGQVVYRRCPACRKTMRRRNFADCSGVIVDECSTRGMFLDPGEYEAIETFIGAGGFVVQPLRRQYPGRDRVRRDGVRVHEQLLRLLIVGLCLAAGCRPSESPEPDGAPPEPARVEPAFDPASTIWTAERAADPELLHLHVQAAVAPGAFVVPWLEGVTFRPCAVRVEQGDHTLQTVHLSYDDDERLVAIAVDDESRPLERNEDGRLLRAHGFEYIWNDGRVERMIEPKARVHALAYDGEGRLVGIESTLADESPLRRHVLSYDEDERLEVRRFNGSSGGHGVTHFVYDERGRLVRIDVEFTDPAGIQQRQPAVRLEYEANRLVEFGRARIAYDEVGRVASLIDATTVTRYDYDCDCD